MNHRPNNRKRTHGETAPSAQTPIQTELSLQWQCINILANSTVRADNDQEIDLAPLVALNITKELLSYKFNGNDSFFVTLLYKIIEDERFDIGEKTAVPLIKYFIEKNILTAAMIEEAFEFESLNSGHSAARILDKDCGGIELIEILLNKNLFTRVSLNSRLGDVDDIAEHEKNYAYDSSALLAVLLEQRWDLFKLIVEKKLINNLDLTKKVFFNPAQSVISAEIGQKLPPIAAYLVETEAVDTIDMLFANKLISLNDRNEMKNFFIQEDTLWQGEAILPKRVASMGSLFKNMHLPPRILGDEKLDTTPTLKK